MVNKKDIFDNIEQSNIEKKKKILKKFEIIEKRKEENNLKNTQKLQEIVYKYKKDYENLHFNKMKLDQNRELKNKTLLQYHVKHAEKAKHKEEEVQLSRSNAQ
jgi:hypothetical protein